MVPRSNGATYRCSAPPKAQTVSFGSYAPPSVENLYQTVLHRPIGPARLINHWQNWQQNRTYYFGQAMQNQLRKPAVRCALLALYFTRPIAGNGLPATRTLSTCLIMHLADIRQCRPGQILFERTTHFTAMRGLPCSLLTSASTTARSQSFGQVSVRAEHLFDPYFDHDYFFKLPWQGAVCPIKWTAFHFTP
jgi:hypothetical protein